MIQPSFFCRLALVLITSLVLPASALRGQFLSWSYENILTDARQSGANPDLFTDAAGNFHVSYWHAGTDKLVYARRSKSTGQWSIEYVPDNGGYGFKSAIILDNAGTIHIAYHHNNLGQATLRYAKKQAGQWTITNLFSDASIGTYGSDPNFPGNVQHSLDITLRADGLPSILFFNGNIFSVTPCTGVDLTYSSYQLDLNTLNLLPSGQWQHHEFANVPYNGNTGCLNSGDRFGEFCQFIKGTGNQYYALANSLHNHELLLFESNPATTLSSWTANRLDSVARLFGPTSVAYFREGYDHIASSQQGDSILHIVYGLTNFYGASPSFPGRETFIYARVHLDSIHVAGYHPFYHTFSPLNVSRSYYSITYTDGAPLFITYFNRQSGAVVVAESNDQGQSWTENTLFTILTNTSLKSEIVGDSLFVLHYDALRDGMGLSARSLSGSTWVHQTATRTEVNGLDFSSAIQRSPGGDKIHIAFTETASDQLYYGVKEGGTWDFDPVDMAGKEAGSVATGITPQGNPVLAYVQEADETLKFARKNGGSWTFQTIDASARPREVVMRMVGDSVHICYFDRLQGALKYARSNGSAPWVVTVLDSSSQIMGRLPSIEADASGNLHLSYQDALNSRLRYAVRKNGAWTRSYITQPVLNAPSFNDIALNSAGKPSVVFRDGIANSIFLAEYNDTTWQIAEVEGDLTSQVGVPVKLIIDSKDRPWVLYNYSSTLDEVRLVRRLSTGWAPVSVTNNGAEIANVFDFHRVGDDLYIAGKKNQIANEGLGLLYASNGITTLVEGDALALGLELYPNPSQGELNIAFRNPVAQPVQIALYSLEGRLMHTISGGETLQAGPVNLSWDAGNLPSGVYLLRMVTSEAVYSLRWMLLR